MPDDLERQLAGQLDGLVGRGVVDEDDLGDVLERDLGDGLAQRRGRLPGGHDDDRPSASAVPLRAQTTSRLNVDGSAPAQQHLDARPQATATGQQDDPGGDRGEPPAARSVGSLRASGRRSAW